MNPGVFAVVLFYLLAGAVVSHLITDVLPGGRGQLARFYLDRILRIFPMYLYVLGLTSIFLILTSFGSPQVRVVGIINNLFIIPLNFFMVTDSTILTNPSWCLVPPAWSLGAELQAYILLPFVLKSKIVKVLLLAATFTVYTLANLSILQPDYFGYRLIAGVFFIFIVGSCIQRSNLSTAKKTGDIYDRWLPIFVWVAVFINAIIFYYTKSFAPASYTRETFLGILVGIPLVNMSLKSKKKFPLNSLVGSLSYGIFLSHFLVIWFLKFVNVAEQGNVGYIVAVSMLSVIISYAGVVVVEGKVQNIRYRQTARQRALAGTGQVTWL